MTIAQFVKAVRVKRDYEIEVELNKEDKARSATTILALVEKVGQAV